MTEFSSPKLENPNNDFASQGMRLHAMEQTVRSRSVLAHAMGAHEHAALVAAVKHNFPEIYDNTGESAGVAE
jgi:hypothetical protein